MKPQMCILQHQGPDMVDDMGHKRAAGPGENVREFWEVFLIPWRQGSHWGDPAHQGTLGLLWGRAWWSQLSVLLASKGWGPGRLLSTHSAPMAPLSAVSRGRDPDLG